MMTTKEKTNQNLLNWIELESVKNLPATLSDKSQSDKSQIITAEIQRHNEATQELCSRLDTINTELAAKDITPERKDELLRQSEELRQTMTKHLAEGEFLTGCQQRLMNETLSIACGNAEMIQLSDKTHSKELTQYLRSENPTQKMVEMLQNQFAAAHRMAMLILGQVYEDEATVSSIRTATRLMATCQNAAQVIQKLQTGGQQTILVQHQNVQVNGGQAVVANELYTKEVGGGDDDRK